ncbi:hypothetical protein SMACR_09200 [Sordaria macrospora]|uniref:WGS project CABT00000000 data, contig 2.76 n=2 Tax=Sordaria macrospora TaxID=5147 RepID=F7WBH8_SORMK|nr:uncharacterized protein SMAC_09200 [Sordaria macrospora k-hell]KAA8635554.1 hypothetical protein SMACR_09200 [Sordaria macrospora]WPJ66298.1 hypothetical protein SMAC4_09200 [Sordaria macrospora]CCC14419.1 unnamed protein product [Sordaria macrospora k-hell]
MQTQAADKILSDQTDIAYRLQIHSRKLINTWKRLSPELFSVEGEEFRTPSEYKLTLDTLRDTILQAEKRREAKKRSWVKERFLNFIDMMDNHKYLLEFIPKGDKYVSLFTGVISSAVKVSLEHRKISETFSMALLSITTELARVKRTEKISNSPQMRLLVVDLYVGFFQMLCGYMDWLQMGTLGRFWASCSGNFYAKNVEILTKQVQESVRQIENEADLVLQSRMKDVHTIVGLVGEGLAQRTIGQGSRYDDEVMSREKLNRIGEMLGSSNVRALDSVEQQVAHEQTERAALKSAHANAIRVPTTAAVVSTPTAEPRPEANHVEQDVVMEIDEEETEEAFMHRSDLEQHIHHLLERYLEDGRTDVARQQKSSLSAILPREVVIHLQTWISEFKSSIRWVVGTPVSPFGSGLSVAALRLCDVSSEIGIPCISFICKQMYNFASPSSTNMKGKRFRLDLQEAGLIALLYSVITQLIYLLPDEPFPINPVLDRSNFEQLDGSMASAPVALRIIRELATYAPPSLIWVIDNLQLTESTTTMPHLREFIAFLREQTSATELSDEGGTQRLSKVCFTTDGNSFVLAEEVGVMERINASRISQRRPGTRLRGGQDVRDLGRRWQ